jgi:hypothetical protein
VTPTFIVPFLSGAADLCYRLMGEGKSGKRTPGTGPRALGRPKCQDSIVRPSPISLRSACWSTLSLDLMRFAIVGTPGGEDVPQPVIPLMTLMHRDRLVSSSVHGIMDDHGRVRCRVFKRRGEFHLVRRDA